MSSDAYRCSRELPWALARGAYVMRICLPSSSCLFALRPGAVPPAGHPGTPALSDSTVALGRSGARPVGSDCGRPGPGGGPYCRRPLTLAAFRVLTVRCRRDMQPLRAASGSAEAGAKVAARPPSLPTCALRICTPASPESAGGLVRLSLEQPRVLPRVFPGPVTWRFCGLRSAVGLPRTDCSQAVLGRAQKGSA